MLEVMNPFLSFLHTYIGMMLNLRFKSMCLITNYVGHNNAMTLVAKCDNNLLLPFINEGYKHQCPLTSNIVSHHGHNCKNFERHCWYKDLHLLLISCWLKQLKMCINLMAHEKIEVSNNCWVGETNYKHPI